MLKIKDNVQLNELEKYGFKTHIYFCKNKVIELLQRKYLNVYSETREIYLEKLEIWQDSRESLELLYDLIKDGLVEKVE